MGFGGSQNKDNMWWGFFKGLEQSIGGFLGKHVDLIYDIDLVMGLVWSVVDPLAEISNIVNAPIAGSINLYHIQSPTLGYCLADVASVARFTLTVSKAIYRFSQNAPGAGFPCSPWATEKIGVRHPTTAQGIE